MSRLSDYWSVEGDAGGYFIVDGHGNELFPDMNFGTRSEAERYLEKLLVEEQARHIKQEMRRAG